MTAATITWATTTTTVEAEGVISAAILRECRRLLGLRQDAMAEKLMVDLVTYRSWENARRSITRLPLHRFKALVRGLTEIGASAAYLDLIELAVEVDLAIGRALISDDNPFPPAGRCERWYALLSWALFGVQPLPVTEVGVAKPPRMATVDKRALAARIRRAVDGPTADLDAKTIHTLETLCNGALPCPHAWCDLTCEPFTPAEEGILHKADLLAPTTPERVGDSDGFVRVTPWVFDGPEGVAESGIELDVNAARTLARRGYANFSADQGRALVAALSKAIDMIDPPGGTK